MSKRMKWYAVRCCCAPTKIMGFLKLEDNDSAGERLVHVMDKDRISYPIRIETISGHHSVSFPITISVKEAIAKEPIVSAKIAVRFEELAVYGEDRPIEFWKNFKDFIPAQGEEDS